MPDECNFEGNGTSRPTVYNYNRWEDLIGEEAAEDFDWLRGTQLASGATRPLPSSSEPNMTRLKGVIDFIVISWVFCESESADGVNVRVSNSLVCPKALTVTSDKDEGDDDEDSNEEGNGDGDGDEDGSSTMTPPLFAVS